MRPSNLIHFSFCFLLLILASTHAFAQKALPLGKDEILQSFSRAVSFNPVTDELLIFKESQTLVAHFQSEGHFEIYYYIMELDPEANNLKLKSFFKPLFMVSPAETSFEQLSLNEKKIVSLTVDEAIKKKSTKWTSYLVPELTKWLSGQELAPASCRKAVSKVGNLLN